MRPLSQFHPTTSPNRVPPDLHNGFSRSKSTNRPQSITSPRPRPVRNLLPLSLQLINRELDIRHLSLLLLDRRCILRVGFGLLLLSSTTLFILQFLDPLSAELIRLLLRLHKLRVGVCAPLTLQIHLLPGVVGSYVSARDSAGVRGKRRVDLADLLAHASYFFAKVFLDRGFGHVLVHADHGADTLDSDADVFVAAVDESLHFAVVVDGLVGVVLPKLVRR